MKKTSVSILCACAVLFAVAANANEKTTLTEADRCLRDSYQEIFREKAGTAATVEIEIAPLQKECEEKTGTAVQHPDLLKKGPGPFRAGGTEFIYK